MKIKVNIMTYLLASLNLNLCFCISKDDFKYYSIISWFLGFNYK